MLKIFIIICAVIGEFAALSLAKFLNLNLSFNYGISFGIFNNFKYAALVLSGLSLIIILCCVMIKFKNYKINLALALMAGGAAANFIERVYLGYVIDYINIFDLNVLNLADIEIMSGCLTALYLFYMRKDF